MNYPGFDIAQLDRSLSYARTQRARMVAALGIPVADRSGRLVNLDGYIRGEIAQVDAQIARMEADLVTLSAEMAA